MTTRNGLLLHWLRDAHAMEQQSEQMLKTQIFRLENYPRLKKHMKLHLEETIFQKEQLENCIKRLGSHSSVLKDFSAKLIGLGQMAGNMLACDEVIQGAIDSYVFENLEIASYTILITAAENADDLETKQVCQQILSQEKAMSAWLLENLTQLAKAFLVRSELAVETAKR
ncbi:ferritin-like domain-containing protein [Legionella cardiaca]|uniref:Ferritin-like domain-containing protein n=1 Tax=Legionella cardiaca TaxID=1071983 RepID=A0ABY8AYP6_9GAMM|nr:ferritin-like domain-containing protein [Legionella cardiaca]WED44227.1 ferritin-like domain-containing protein [Legionella cardiaca]